MKLTTLYIGLNDKDTKKQIVSKKQAIEIVDRILNCDYTLLNAQGRYKHNDDTIVTESTLVIQLLDIRNITDKIEAIRFLLNQECIMVTTQNINVKFYVNNCNKLKQLCYKLSNLWNNTSMETKTK